MVGASDFIYGIYINIHSPHMNIESFAFMCNFMTVFVPGTYMYMPICEADVAAGNLLAYVL